VSSSVPCPDCAAHGHAGYRDHESAEPCLTCKGDCILREPAPIIAPCPFCGGAEAAVDYDCGVICPCGAAGPNLGDVENFEDDEAFERKALEVWNRRAERGRQEALERVADSLCHTVFVDAGLTLEQASKALLVSRRVVESVERSFEERAS
jgi:hypothetical protein